MTMTRTFKFNGVYKTYTVEKEMEMRGSWSICRFAKVKELRDYIFEIIERDTGHVITTIMREEQLKDMYPNVYERLVLN